jgi:hypothetical protein
MIAEIEATGGEGVQTNALWRSVHFGGRSSTVLGDFADHETTILRPKRARRNAVCQGVIRLPNAL